MKTIILSIAILLLITLTIATQSFAATNSGAETELREISGFDQIEVHGNVELYISYGETNHVKVYDNYYHQNELIQQQNGTLRISSYKTQKLVVWVTLTR